MANSHGLLDKPPATPDYRATKGHFPRCGKCKRRIGDGGPGGLWRCPYTDCREWLRGTSDPEPKKPPKVHA